MSQIPASEIVGVNNTRGILFASAVIPVGVTLWILIWQTGLIASLVALVVAVGAVWLYKKGARTNSTKGATVPLLIIIATTVIFAFFGGMVSDAWAAYTNEIQGTEGFFSADFWGLFFDNITRSELWSQYTSDITATLVLAAIGAGGVVHDLFQQPSEETVEVS